MATNLRKCTCKICGNTIQAGQGFKTYSKNKYGFICSNCKELNQGGILKAYTYKNHTKYNLDNAIRLSNGWESYNDENRQRINEHTKTNDCTISIELEIPHEALNYNKTEDFKWLINQGFYATHDGTVWKEFKSPIYNNLLGLSKTLHNLENINKLNQWNNSNEYGTHNNIGNSALTENNLNIIKRFYHSLFVPYSNYLVSNSVKCKTLYGRKLEGWARPINENSNVTEHSNFINMQHNTHIEFRVNKLITAKQYLMACRLNQDIIQKVIANYFLAKYNEGMSASKKRELAKKSSEKMIKLFEKYYNKLLND